MLLTELSDVEKILLLYMPYRNLRMEPTLKAFKGNETYRAHEKHRL
jgi:hypothetical protein